MIISSIRSRATLLALALLLPAPLALANCPDETGEKGRRNEFHVGAHLGVGAPHLASVGGSARLIRWKNDECDLAAPGPMAILRGDLGVRGSSLFLGAGVSTFGGLLDMAAGPVVYRSRGGTGQSETYVGGQYDLSVGQQDASASLGLMWNVSSNRTGPKRLLTAGMRVSPRIILHRLGIGR